MDFLDDEAEDGEILEEMKCRKKMAFCDIINKKKLNKFELDEALNEA